MNRPATALACLVEHVPPHVFEGPRGRYRIRAARPSDEPGLRQMLEAAAPDDIRLRFFRHIRRFPHEFVEPLTRADEGCHFAFVALTDDAAAAVVASAMMVADAAGHAAEFGIIVARAAAGQRLGSHLLNCLIDEARGRGIGTIFGLILADNGNMIDLARRLGFSIGPDPEEPGCVRAELRVAGPLPAQ